MATIRRAGFGSVFEVENETVGIGTTGTATNTVQVLGETKASGALIAGFSTFTTYQGFVDSRAEFGNSNVDINSSSGTTGDIEICHGDFNVSSASTLTSSVNQLTVTNSFSAPTGDTDSRIHCHTAGSMRFNEDLGTLEFYTGDEWRTVNSFKDTGNRGRMLIMGGNNASQYTEIQLIQINTRANSTIFGELTQKRSHNTALANEIRGLCLGGLGPETNIIDYVTPASEGDAIDFGDLQTSKFGGGGACSSTRGLFCGGYDSPQNKDVIDYIEIMTLGDALDFGDLTRARRYGTSVASPTRVVTSGGTGDSYSSTENGARMTDIFTISSKGNAIDFEPLSGDGQQMAGFTDGIRGIFLLNDTSGGVSKMDQLNVVSGGNVAHHGELERLTSAQPAGGCNHVRGLFAGGFNTPGTNLTNHIDMIEIQTSGNATDFGDLALVNAVAHGCSDSHGGLGGF